jgi:hypothetical protein
MGLLMFSYCNSLEIAASTSLDSASSPAQSGFAFSLVARATAR